MTIDIILAGVPKGEDYWGPKEDRSYYATFYTGAKNEDSRFLVEVRQSGEKTYCYYNYLKYNTIDSETRGGGFFCLALRTDMYCKDVVKVYHFLDIIFNRYILNGILQATPQGLRYQITRFDTKTQDIQVMQKVMIDFLQMSLTGNDFAAFDSSFSMKKVPGAEVNFSDCTKENLLAAIKKYASISLSTTAWLNRERNAQQTFESRLANSVAIKEQEMANLQNELSQKQSLCTKLQADVSERDKQILLLNNEIKAKEAELKQVSIRKDVSQIIAQIKEPIARLASYTGFSSQSVRQDSYSQREEQEREDSSIMQGIVTKALPILNLIVLLGIGGYLYYSANNKFGINDNTFLLQSIEEKLATLESAEVQPSVVESKTEDIPVSGVEEKSVSLDFSEMRIDIKEYTGSGPLIIDKEYIVRVINPAKSGEWNITGCEVLSKNADQARIKLVKPGDVDIRYMIDGQVAKQRNVPKQ